METSFQKVQKERHYILIAHWSHNTYALLYTQTKGTTIQTSYTVKYFLIECGDLVLTRQHFFNANNLKDLFENVDIDDILSLREIKLYQNYIRRHD